MAAPDNGLLLYLAVIVVWVVVLVEVLRRPISPVAKAGWIVVCTLFWPALIAYLLLRPTVGRLERAEDRTQPQARLVDAVLAHEAGRLDSAGMAAVIEQLRDG